MVTADLETTETRTDVGATQAAPPPASVTESNPDDLQEALALLEEIDGKATQDATSEAGTESTEAGTEPDELENDAVEAARQAAAETAARETEDRLRQEADAEKNYRESERQLEGIETAYRQRTQRLRGHLEAVARGEQDLNVEGIIAEFNQHHAQQSPVMGKAYWDAGTAFAKANLPEPAYQSLMDGITKGRVPDFPAFLGALKGEFDKQAVNGRFTEAQVKEKEALKALSIRRRFETDEAFRNAWLSRVKPAESRGANAFTPSTQNLDPDSLEGATALLKSQGLS